MADKFDYTNKDYASILSELIEISPSLTQAYDPQSENDPAAFLLKSIALVGDMLSFYLDKQALETAPLTMTQRKVADAFYRMMGYYMSWYTPATTEAVISNYGLSSMRLPKYTRFTSSSDNTSAVLLEDTRVPSGSLQRLVSSSGSTGYVTSGDSGYQITLTDPNVTFKLTYSSTNDLVMPVLSYESGESTISLTSTYDSTTRSYIFNYSDTVTLSLDFIDSTGAAHYGTSTVTLYEGSVAIIKSQIVPEDSEYYLTPATSQRIFFDSVIVKDSNGSTWTQVEDIDKYPQLGQYYDVRADEYDQILVKFSEYLETAVAQINVIAWVYSQGVGTTILADSLVGGRIYQSDLETSLSQDILNTYLSITSNTLSPQATQGPETAQEAYRNSQLYINTTDTLITCRDYQNAIRRVSPVSNCVVTDNKLESQINSEQGSEMTSGEYKARVVFGNFDDSINLDGVQASINSYLENLRSVSLTQNLSTEYYILQWQPRGTITLSESVTQSEAIDLLSKICLNLCNDYHPSNMEFGQGVSLLDLIEKIKSYDERILLVDLKPITYVIYKHIEKYDLSGPSESEEESPTDDLVDLYKAYITGNDSNGFSSPEIVLEDGSTAKKTHWQMYRLYDTGGSPITTSGYNFNYDIFPSQTDAGNFITSFSGISDVGPLSSDSIKLDPSDFFNEYHPCRPISIARFANYKYYSGGSDGGQALQTFMSNVSINKENISK